MLNFKVKYVGNAQNDAEVSGGQHILIYLG